MDESACCGPYDSLDFLTDGDCYIGPAISDLLTRGSGIVRMTIVDPEIVWSWPEPRKPTLDEQCDQAMVSVRALIDDRCAQHRVAIRANHEWDMIRMERRHTEWGREAAIDRQCFRLLKHINRIGFYLEASGLLDAPSELHRDLRD